MTATQGWRGLAWWYKGVRVSVDGRRCVRSISPLSRCTQCRDECPRAAIQWRAYRSTQLPSIEPSCDECGRCATVCPTNAIVLPNQVSGTRRELLGGWLLRSPHHRREQAVPVRTVVLPSTCDGCGVCAKLCPEGLLSSVLSPRSTAPKSIQSDRCNGCRLCADVCTAGQVQILVDRANA